MKTKILFTALLFNSLLFAEYQPKEISKDEYKELNEIDKTIYDLAIQSHHYDIKSISNFIYSHLAYDLEFTRLKITSSLSLRHSSSDSVYNETGYTTNKDSYALGVRLSYPLFDKKEVNDRLKQIVTVKKQIIALVTDYFKLKAKIDDFKVSLQIKKALEIRTKARKLDGVGSFDEWLQILEDIKDLNYKLSVADVELKEKFQTLVSHIQPNAKEQLQELLK